MPTKVRLVKPMVFPVVMYGYESWTMKKAECRRIDAFELCCWKSIFFCNSLPPFPAYNCLFSFLQSWLQHAVFFFFCCSIGIQFPDQGLNPGHLHWKHQSQPLDHQGSPLGKTLESPLDCKEIKSVHPTGNQS